MAVLLTAGWSWELLDRTPQWQPWLRLLVVVAAVACLAALTAGTIWRSLARRLAVPVIVLGVVACLAGPVAYAAQTVTTAHTGSVPSAGPSSGGGGFGGGGFGGAGMPAGGGSAARGGGFPGGGGARAHGGAPPSGNPAGLSGATRASGGTPGPGGPGQATVTAALTRALESNAGRYRWVAATSGSQSAASLELATGGEPVMAIGGFDNEGGSLTLAQFKQYVSSGAIHYYLASGGGAGGGGAGGGGASSSDITTWVKAHYKAVTIGGATVYDLTQPAT
jgi:hypothetical protein